MYTRTITPIWVKIAVVMVLLIGSGCEDEKDKDGCWEEAPQWLITLAEGDTLPLGVADRVFTEWEYQGSYYIEFEHGLLSCMHCYIYDCDGNPVSWTNEEIIDYDEHRKNPRQVWP